MFDNSRALTALVASLALLVPASGCGGDDEATTTGEAGSAATGGYGAGQAGGDAKDAGADEAAEASGPKSLDTRALANSLDRFFDRLEPREPWRVKCPQTVPPDKGRNFKCTVAGERVIWRFTVVQLNGQGRISYTGKPQYLREFPGADPKIKITRTTTLDIEP